MKPFVAGRALYSFGHLDRHSETGVTDTADDTNAADRFRAGGRWRHRHEPGSLVNDLGTLELPEAAHKEERSRIRWLGAFDPNRAIRVIRTIRGISSHLISAAAAELDPARHAR